MRRLPLADTSAAALRESNQQLQAELDHCRQDLATARRRTVEVERRLQDREEVISETRQRLFEAQQRSAKLEDELRNQEEVQRSLQNRLQGARAQTTATEVELRQVRHALSSASGLDTESEMKKRSSVPYSFPGGVSGGTMDVTRPPSPSVSQADELAASFGSEKGSMLQRAPRDSLASKSSFSFGSDASSQQPLSLPPTSKEVWAQTMRVSRPLGALIRRSPAAGCKCRGKRVEPSIE